MSIDNEFDNGIKTAMVYVRPVPGAMDVVDQIVRIREWLSGRGVETEYFTVGHGDAGGVGFQNALDRIGQGGIDALIALEPSVLWTDDAERERVESVCSAHGTRVVFVYGGSDADDAGAEAEGVIPHEDPVLPDGISLAEDAENGCTCAVIPEEGSAIRFTVTLVGDFQPVDMDCGHTVRWDMPEFGKGGVEYRHGVVTAHGVSIHVMFAENDMNRTFLMEIPTVFVREGDSENVPKLVMGLADFVADIMCEDGWVLVNPTFVDRDMFEDVGSDSSEESDGEDASKRYVPAVMLDDPADDYVRVCMEGMVEWTVLQTGDTEAEILMGSAGKSLEWNRTEDLEGIVVRMGSFKTRGGKMPVAYRVKDGKGALYLFPGTIYVRRDMYAEREDFLDALMEVVEVFMEFMEGMGWELDSTLVLGAATVRGNFGRGSS